MRIYLSTVALEEARGQICGSCGKDEAFTNVLDINTVYSLETGAVYECHNCSELTLVLDDDDYAIDINKPVMVDWVTELTEPAAP